MTPDLWARNEDLRRRPPWITIVVRLVLVVATLGLAFGAMKVTAFLIGVWLMTALLSIGRDVLFGMTPFYGPLGCAWDIGRYGLWIWILYRSLFGG